MLTSTLAFSWHWQLDGWIVAAGILCAMSCALLGNFLVLRKMSMMGDAISHAVLPGLAIAFLVTHSRESLPMFIGAAIVGVLTALFTQWINRFGRVEESASMGVVFTSLFAIGLILIVRAADHVDLDPGCVLYGAIEMVPLDVRNVFGFAIPRAVVTLAIVFAGNLLFVVLFYKELKISSFDPELATTLGMNATVMHYLLMTFTAITTVAAFESVGSILVVAMLIVPAAAAHLLTERLSWMIGVSLMLAVLSAVGGHVAALTVPTWFGFSDTSTAGMMAVVAGLLFTVAMLLAPRHGVISRVVHRGLLTLRIAREDILGLMYRLEEVQGGEPYTAAAAMLREGKGVGHVTSAVAVRDLLRRKQAVRSDGGFRLTDAGRDAARQLVRSHRLWEEYLQKHLNLPADHVHAPAERLEHVTDDAMREELDAYTDRPQTDPQGKTIPARVRLRVNCRRASVRSSRRASPSRVDRTRRKGGTTMHIVRVRPFVTPILVVVVVAVLAMCATGCEQEEFTPLPTTAPSSSSRVPATRRALPTSDEIFGSRAATTPSTLPTAATTRAAVIVPDSSDSSVPREPTDTPDHTVTRLFELMQKQDVAGVRAMLADPPEPERLRVEVAVVAERLNRGATWAIVDRRTEGVAAVVIFRTKFPDGKEEFTPLPLVNRYDRWRVVMGALNAKKLSPGERTGITRLAPWAEQRLNELRGVPTTTPASQAVKQ